MTTDFAATRARFHLPDGVIYLDGNSLGPLPRAAAARVADCVTAEWGEMLITAWNRAGWMEMPRRLGDRIGRLIGAEPGTVVLGDTLSIKVYQATFGPAARSSCRIPATFPPTSTSPTASSAPSATATRSAPWRPRQWKTRSPPISRS